MSSPVTVFALVAVGTGGAAVAIITLPLTGGAEAERESGTVAA